MIFLDTSIYIFFVICIFLTFYIRDTRSFFFFVFEKEKQEVEKQLA